MVLRQSLCTTDGPPIVSLEESQAILPDGSCSFVSLPFLWGLGKGVFAGRRGGGGRTPACYLSGFRADKSCEPDGGSVGVLCGMTQRVCIGAVRHITVDRAARFLTDVPVCLRETIGCVDDSIRRFPAQHGDEMQFALCICFRSYRHTGVDASAPAGGLSGYRHMRSIRRVCSFILFHNCSSRAITCRLRRKAV